MSEKHFETPADSESEVGTPSESHYGEYAPYTDSPQPNHPFPAPFSSPVGPPPGPPPHFHGAGFCGRFRRHGRFHGKEFEDPRLRRRRGAFFLIKVLALLLFGVSVFASYNYGRLQERKAMMFESRHHGRGHPFGGRHFRSMEHSFEHGLPRHHPGPRYMISCDQPKPKVKFVDTDGDGKSDFVIKYMEGAHRSHHNVRKGGPRPHGEHKSIGEVDEYFRDNSDPEYREHTELRQHREHAEHRKHADEARKHFESMKHDEHRGEHKEHVKHEGEHKEHVENMKHDGRKHFQHKGEHKGEHKEHGFIDFDLKKEFENVLKDFGLQDLHVPTLEEVAAKFNTKKVNEETN